MIKSETELKRSFEEMIDKALESEHVFTDEIKTLITDMSEFCRGTRLYNSHKDGERATKFRQEFPGDPETIYSYMLYKVANAPNRTTMVASIVLLMPLLDDAIKGRRRRT